MCYDTKTDLQKIGEQAKDHAQNLLDDARIALAEVTGIVKELKSSPLFGNGWAKAAEQLWSQVEELDQRLVKLSQMTEAHFRAEVSEPTRLEVMRGYEA